MSLVAIRLNSLHFKLEYTIHILNIGQKNLSQVEEVVFRHLFLSLYAENRQSENIWRFILFSTIHYILSMFFFFLQACFHIEVSVNVLFKINWRRQWQPSPVLLPGKSHGRRSLVGCSPWSWEESEMTEWLHFHFSLSRIGEGNGNPLQCSCLENPRDGGAWWAAVYGVAQSRTRLKWLSSSSSS